MVCQWEKLNWAWQFSDKRNMKILFFFLFFSASASFATELRRTTAFSFEECDRSQFLTAVPKATAYVTEIANRIMRANPEVFRDDLAPENICIGVQFNNAGGRAFANAASRSFFIETGMLTLAQNDAQIAIVVAHELAHISMRHFHGGYPVTGPAVTQAAIELNRLSSQLSGKGERTTHENDNLQAAIREQNNIIDSAIAAQLGQSVVPNWVEGEANLVGAHFYLQAGFTSDELAWRDQQVAILTSQGEEPSATPPDIPAQDRISQAYAACNVSSPASMSEPSRGVMRYPAECWTIWNLRHQTPQMNPQYRTQMNDSTSIVNLSLPADSNLAAVKEEVEAYQPEDPKAAKRSSKKGRMPASAKPVKETKKSQNKNSHHHDGCRY